MSEKSPPEEDLIELPLTHKETWDSVDKGGSSGGRTPPAAARPDPARSGSTDAGAADEHRPRRGAGRSSDGVGAATASRRPTGGPRDRKRPSPRSSWKIWVGLLAIAAVAYWLFWPSAPRVEFSVSPLEFPPQRAGRDSEPLTVTLKNVGERVLRIDSVGVARAGLDDFVTDAEDCGRAELSEGAECQITLLFTPQAPGARAGQLDVIGNMRGKQSTLPLVGEAVAPRLTSRPEVLDFGSESVDATTPGQELELVNDGTARLEIDRVTVDSSEGEFRLIGNKCSSSSLDPGESCVLRLVFTPRLLGRRTAQIEVLSDSFGDVSPIVLQGTGSGPDLEIRPEGLVFEAQLVGTRSAAATLTLFNRGDQPYRINRAWIEDGGPFSVEQENCSGASIEPSKSCRVVVVFAPRSEGEARTTLQIRESSGGMAPGIGISGAAVSPKLELSATTIGFGALPVGETTGRKSLRISNGGTATLTLSQLKLAGGDAAAFSKIEDSCSGVRLTPRQRCQVDFDFRPSHPGTHQASLAVASNQPGAAPKVALTGHGQAPAITLDRRHLDFAAVRQTESQDLRVGVSNSGDAPLRIGSISIAGAAAGDFQLAGNGCSQATVAPGTDCLLVVRFAPDGNGPRDARLLIDSDAGSGTVELVIRGVGLAPPEPDIAIAPRLISFGAWQVGDRSEVQTLTISSTGAGRLKITEYRLTGADAGDFRVVPGTCQGLPYLAPNGTCTFGVRFTASSVGAKTAILEIQHNAKRGPVRIELNAEGF